MEITEEEFCENNETKKGKMISKKRQKGWQKKLISKAKKNKLFTTVLITFVMFSTMNFFMIYNFMKILQNL